MSKTPAQQISSLLLTRRSQGLLKICNKLLLVESLSRLNTHPLTLDQSSSRSGWFIFQPQTLVPTLSRSSALPVRYFKYERNLYKTFLFQATVNTTTSSKPSMMAWAVSCVLCFTMLWPCFCVPFCVDSLKNVKHTCPNCKSTLGRYKGGL